jgi:hypothetical protein
VSCLGVTRNRVPRALARRPCVARYSCAMGSLPIFIYVMLTFAESRELDRSCVSLRYIIY